MTTSTFINETAFIKNIKSKTVLIIGKQADKLQRPETKYRQLVYVELEKSLRDMVMQGKTQFLFYSCRTFERMALLILERLKKEYQEISCLQIHSGLFPPVMMEEGIDAVYRLTGKTEREQMAQAVSFCEVVLTYVPVQCMERICVYQEAWKAEVKIINIKEIMDEYDLDRKLPEATKEQFRMFMEGMKEDRQIDELQRRRKKAIEELKERIESREENKEEKKCMERIEKLEEALMKKIEEKLFWE